MKLNKGKIVFWLLIIVFAGIIVFQNQEFFFSKQKLDVSLYFTQFTIPLTPVVAMFVIVFVAGWLISFIPASLVRYRLKKTVKNLNAKLENQKADLASLKEQVASLKTGGSLERPPEATDAEIVAEKIETETENEKTSQTTGEQETQETKEAASAGAEKNET